MDDGFIIICLSGDRDVFTKAAFSLFGLTGSGFLKRQQRQSHSHTFVGGTCLPSFALQGYYKETNLIRLALALASLCTQAEGEGQSCHL